MPIPNHQLRREIFDRVKFQLNSTIPPALMESFCDNLRQSLIKDYVAINHEEQAIKEIVDDAICRERSPFKFDAYSGELFIKVRRDDVLANSTVATFLAENGEKLRLEGGSPVMTWRLRGWANSLEAVELIQKFNLPFELRGEGDIVFMITPPSC